MAAILTEAEPTAQRSQEREERFVGSRRFSAANVVVLVFLVVMTIYFLTPLYWLVISSTKDNSDLFATFGLWFGNFSLFDNLQQLFTHSDGVFGRWMLNTFIYAGLGGAASTVISLMAGYALAKFKFMGRNLIFALVLGAVLVPATTIALPLYLLESKIGITNTYWALLLPSLLNPLGVYLARVYCAASVPDDLMAAARIDGANELRIFRSVVLPMMIPGMVTIFLFQFVAIWNNFFTALVVLSDPNLFPVNLGLATWNFDPASHQLLYNLIVTGSLVSVIPLVALFLLLQRYWRSGLTFGSLTG
jgi:multiple sugar transport system permease protein